MTKQTKELPFKDWREDLRIRWELAFAKGDFLDEDGPGAHLKPATRATWRSACGRFLRFLQLQQGEPFPTLQESLINPDVLSAYVDYRRPSCSATELRQLRHALRLIFPGLDLGWLLNASKRIASQAAPKPRKHHLVTSERLYLLGLELMDGAIEQSNATGEVSKVCAFQYRDGLIILLLALIPLRRRTLTALRVGKHLVRAGNAWMLDIPREDTKTDEQLEFLLCETLSRRIDLYLERFRGRIPNAATHTGLWVSNKGNPMAGGTIYDMVIRRTRKTLGFGVTLHRFRHAAPTLCLLMPGGGLAPHRLSDLPS